MPPSAHPGARAIPSPGTPCNGPTRGTPQPAPPAVPPSPQPTQASLCAELPLASALNVNDDVSDL